MMRIKKMLIALAALALVVSACGNAGVEDTTTTPQATTTTTEASTTSSEAMTTTTEGTTTSTAEPVASFTDGMFASEEFPGAGDTLYLTDVKVTTFEQFDRLTFEFDDTANDLTYQIEPVETPILQQPSGQEIEVDGLAYYEITMTPASAVDLSGDEPVETYDGPERITADNEAVVVTEVVATEDFESVMSWVVGLDTSGSYAHEIRLDEGMLVVDFQS